LSKYTGESQINRSLAEESNINIPSSSSCSAKQGDEIISSHGPPDIIKVDVEGAELEVLKDFKRSLSEQTIGKVYVEVHSSYLLKRTTGFLTTMDYSHDIITKRSVGDSEEFFLRASR